MNEDERSLINELIQQTLQVDPFRLFPADRRYETYNPSDFLRSKGYRVIKDMLVDDQVKAALHFKKLSVLASGWRIDVPDDEPDDYAPAEFVRRQLNHIDGDFNESLLGMLTCLDYGFSVTEKVYRQADGEVQLAKLTSAHPQFLTLQINEYGDFLGVKQNVTGGNPVELPPGKVMLMSNEPRFGNLYGESDLHAAYKHWWGKTAIFRYTMMYMERFGIPPIFGLIDTDRFTQGQINELQTLLKNIQASTTGLIPRKGGADTFDLWSPSDSGRISSVFEPVLKMLDQNIARALLMPGLLGMTPDDAAGSYARSEVHFDVFMLVIERLRQKLEALVNEQLVWPLVSLNYNIDEDKLPRFEFLPLNDDVRLDILETWTNLITAGSVRSGEGDEAHIRMLLRFPETEQLEGEDGEVTRLNGDQIKAATEVLLGLRDGNFSPDAARELLIAAGLTPAAADRVVGSTEVREAPPALPGPNPPSEGDGEDEEEDEGEEGIALNRQMTAAEQRIDFAQIDADLNEQEAAAVESLIPLLTVWRDRLVKQALKEDLSLDKTKPAPKLKTAMGAVLREHLETVFDIGRVHLAGEVGRFATPVGVTPESAIAYLDGKAFWVTGVMAQGVEEAVQSILVESLRQGMTAAETAAGIRATFVPWLGDPDVIADDAVTDPYRLETIVRTNTTDAYNQGRLVAIRDPDVAGIVKGVEYSAIMDTRTSEICSALDGRIFRPDDPDLDRFTPPNHFNCRSVLVPIILAEDVDASRMVDGATKGRVEDLMQPSFGGNADRR